MKSISVLINARTQSTRVPNKLLRSFANSCLLQIALEKLDKLNFFDHRYLAVAEEELIEMGKQFANVEILRRDDASVRKGVNPLDVTFAHYLNIPSDYIFVFNPCLPCIEPETIRRAYEYFQATNFNSYTAVIETGDWIFDAEGNALTNTDPRNATTNKNMTFMKGCHAFHIINRKFFKCHKILWTFEKDDPHLIQIPEAEAVDVDTLNEFDFAEMVYLKKS